METPGDDVKTYCLLLSLAAYEEVEPDESSRVRVATAALRGLAKAITRDAARRQACRDSDATAATRVRPWSVF